jgi:hypothetical protein
MSFGVTTYDNAAQGIIKANIESLDQSIAGQSSYNTRDIQKYRYDLFQGPSAKIDQKILDSLGPSNTKKGEVNTIGSISNFLSCPAYYPSESDAENAAQTIFGTAAEAGSTGLLSNVKTYFAVGVTTIGPLNLNEGDTVTDGSGENFGTNAWSVTISGSGIYAVKDWNKDSAVSIGSTLNVGSNTTTVESIQYVGVGEIYQDMVAVSAYPNLEPPNSGASSPFTGSQTLPLSGGNLGNGIGNTSYPNGIIGGTFGNLADIQGGIPKIGDALAFDISACPTQAGDISAARGEIGGLRGETQSSSDSATTIKGLKKQYAVNIWSLEKSAADNQATKIQLQSAIGILDGL